MLDKIRISLLTEAQQSPQLLSDLAGLESYVAESYDSRSFIELLQNADDASATSFIVKKSQNQLIIANDGKLFSSSDLEALCRSAASNKERGTTIGYRGIGFKSVVSLANEVHIISGDLKTTFSRDLTSIEVPTATRVPLIRIPHPISLKVQNDTSSEIYHLEKLGYRTFFIFTGLMADSINQEFLDFDASAMLFLKNIKNLILNGARNEEFHISRNLVCESFTSTTLKTTKGESRWLISEEKNRSVAFYQSINSEKIEALPGLEAVVHAFLPTNESTGLGVKINADISTDPSRTRIVFDERTKSEIAAIAQQISTIIISIVNGKRPCDIDGLLEALLPLEDPRLFKYQRKSFKTELIAEIKTLCEKSIGTLVLKPTWLNSVDFDSINRVAQYPTPPRNLIEIEGISNFMRYIGAKEASIYQLLEPIKSSQLSKNGCAEITSELVRLHDTKQFDIAILDKDLPIFYSESGRTSIKDALANNLKLDSSFIDMISERSCGPSGVNRLIKDMAGKEVATALFPSLPVQESTSETAQVNNGLLESIEIHASRITTSNKIFSLKKWRGAEEQVREILEAEGYVVTDVSRQNIGYDIECENKLGDQYFIEVKLIETPSQPFTLTSNEEAVARQKGNSYIVAIVRLGADNIELSLIPDPVNNLSLTRQCRQWVWECNSYPYAPKYYKVQ